MLRTTFEKESALSQKVIFEIFAFPETTKNYFSNKLLLTFLHAKLRV